MDLTWQNHSPTAGEVGVLRTSGVGSSYTFSPVAHLPPGATTFTERPLPAGYYPCRIEARKPGVPSGSNSPLDIDIYP